MTSLACCLSLLSGSTVHHLQIRKLRTREGQTSGGEQGEGGISQSPRMQGSPRACWEFRFL